jgi:CBS domain containing-hemolysin-like protein
VISLKALLYDEGFDPDRRSGECLQPALFVAEDMPVEEALRRMQRSGQRLAILLGSGRREVGLVSLEDILRFLFGEVPA